MKVEFIDKALEELFESGTTKDRRYRNVCKDKKLLQGYIRAVNIMQSVSDTSALSVFSFLHYEKLKYQGAAGKSSVRLASGKIERLLFTEHENGIRVELIEIDDTHYGNKK